MYRVYNFFGGRVTFFALFFAFVGTYLAIHGKLDGYFISLIGGLQTLILAHSVKEDLITAREEATEDASK